MDLAGKRILIAPWGDPGGWVYTRYTHQGEDTWSFTSIALLSRGASRVIVLAADTLARLQTERPSYRDVVESSRAYVEKHLCGVNAEVRILPGVINTSRVTVRGRTSDYYMMTLYTLASILLEEAQGQEGMQVNLDLTHGINYMPTLTYQAAREAATLASSLAGETVLRVYNSDPVIPSPNIREACRRSKGDPCQPESPDVCKKYSAGEPVGINQVIKDQLKPYYLVSYLESVITEALTGKRTVKKLGRLNDKAEKEYNRLISSSRDTIQRAVRLLKLARYGLVPQLLHMVTHEDLQEKVDDAIRGALSLWESQIQVQIKEGALRVERRLALEPGFRALVYASALLSILSPIADMSSLEAARRIKEALYNGGLLEVIQNREQEKLSKLLAEKAQGCSQGQVKVSLAEAYEPMLQESELRGCSAFARDLIAHGGWHTDIITLTIQCKGEDKLWSRTIIGLRDKDPVCKADSGAQDIWQVIDKEL